MYISIEQDLRRKKNYGVDNKKSKKNNIELLVRECKHLFLLKKIIIMKHT